VYRIEPLPPLPATPHPIYGTGDTTALDPDRALILWRVGAPRSLELPGLEVWLLDNDGALVPFEIVERHVDEENRVITELTLGSFGSSPDVLLRTGVLEYKFASAQQAHDWALLAVEGLLVYYADLLPEANHAVRVIAFDRTWTIDDFGYNEGDFRNPEPSPVLPS